jgi:hypothetical protein
VLVKYASVMSCRSVARIASAWLARELSIGAAEVAMRRLVPGLMLGIVALLPNVGRAQVSLTPALPPQTTPATAAFQLRGEPVYHAGAYYYPTGPTVFFDGNVMSRVDSYEGVPIYVDATLTPYSVVYVPVGEKLMRPYERRRAGELAGTVANRTPSFPVQIDSEPSVAVPTVGSITPPPDGAPGEIREALAPVATLGELAAATGRAPRGPVQMIEISSESTQSTQASPQSTQRNQGAQNSSGAQRTPPSTMRLRSAEATREPGARNGVWVSYDGARWYSDGPSVTYSPDRFTQVGEYQGSPVYRAKGATASGDSIFIPSVAGGPVAPFKR